MNRNLNNCNLAQPEKKKKWGGLQLSNPQNFSFGLRRDSLRWSHIHFTCSSQHFSQNFIYTNVYRKIPIKSPVGLFSGELMAGGAYFRRGLLLEGYLCLKFGGIFPGSLLSEFYGILKSQHWVYISLKVLLYFNHGSLKFRCRTSIKNPLSLLERTPQFFFYLWESYMF